MVENRNYNFETNSQLEGKDYITTAELKELKSIHNYVLALTNTEDSYIRYKTFVEKMVWEKTETSSETEA